MFVSDNIDVNAKGNLTIGGIDCTELAEKYGTPLYVMDEDLLRKNCRRYKSALDNFCGGNGLVLYASKSFCCKAMCKIAAEEGFGLDVVSEGELFTALSANFPAERIVFHGNNKKYSELVFAVNSNIGAVVVDNLSELETLNGIAEAAGKNVGIMLRIKPGVDAHTHDFIMTGQIDSKFGFALETGEAFEAIKAALSCKHLTLKSLHCHIGSQIFEVDPYEYASAIMLGLMKKVKDELGTEIPGLNLGGGFGIKYTQNNTPVDYEKHIECVANAVKNECAKLGLNVPKLYFEPGRSISGPAGITLYTVGAVKEIPSIRTYVSIDGGMTDNPRYALYGAQYEISAVKNAASPRSKTVTVAGKCCESGDLIGKDMQLQEVKPGDLVAVFATGAYNYSMSSNYNRIPRPPVVMVSGGSSRVVVKGETLEDVIRNDLD
ncbi:MAG: diaminopimelate decarboxylase [Oscillospiraceae bacterium]|nr:diaminopimelate decarboxylase [Oscillospiraceae bacterium]